MKKVSYTEAEACYNIVKNQYSDKLASELYLTCSPVLPQYAHQLYTLSYTDDGTRVRLRSNGVGGSDYINANFIDVSAR